MLPKSFTNGASAMAAIGNKTNERTNLLHDQGEHLKTVQKVLRQRSAATTTIYQEVTGKEVRQLLKKVGENYDN